MKKYLPICLFVLVLILLVAVTVSLYLFWSDLWPYQLDIPSPTGEYHLEQRYTNFLTPGYRGKTFLVCSNQRYFVDDWGPGGVGWLSDTEFFVGDRHAADETCYHEYSVSDFTSN